MTQEVFQKYFGPQGSINNVEIDVAGYPWSAKGKIKIHNSKMNRLIDSEDGFKFICYDVDTSLGEHGSPIHLIDKSSNTRYIIGIQISYLKDKNLKYGTLITPEIQKWIYETVQSFK